MARSNAPAARRDVLKFLRRVNDSQRYMVTKWTWSAKVLDYDQYDKQVHAYGKKPNPQPDPALTVTAWSELASHCAHVAADMLAMQAIAQQQANGLRNDTRR